MKESCFTLLNNTLQLKTYFASRILFFNNYPLNQKY